MWRKHGYSFKNKVQSAGKGVPNSLPSVTLSGESRHGGMIWNQEAKLRVVWFAYSNGISFFVNHFQRKVRMPEYVVNPAGNTLTTYWIRIAKKARKKHKKRFKRGWSKRNLGKMKGRPCFMCFTRFFQQNMPDFFNRRWAEFTKRPISESQAAKAQLWESVQGQAILRQLDSCRLFSLVFPSFHIPKVEHVLRFMLAY